MRHWYKYNCYFEFGLIKEEIIQNVSYLTKPQDWKIYPFSYIFKLSEI